MPTAKPKLLSIENLKVRRSRDFCLDITKLSLPAGRITCLVGANGSGKTTLMETITGLILPDEGRVSVAGLDPFSDDRAVKANLGFVPDDDGWIIAELTAREYFNLLIAIYGKAGLKADLKQRVEELTKKLLFNSFDQQLGSLSHGNRRKVQLVAGLFHQPRLVVIDELRNGLDPVAAKRAEDLLKEVVKTGSTILAATHDLWWAERLSDDLLVIKDGRIILQAKTEVVKSQAGSVEAKFMELYEL
ncbi:ABC transporter ATP-binding protein [Candidatus Saccharibacteria bacterium]|nr:ABC transporter ATP-binding protein [Candidatus Saccharibacteria bacterium]